MTGLEFEVGGSFNVDLCGVIICSKHSYNTNFN